MVPTTPPRRHARRGGVFCFLAFLSLPLLSPTQARASEYTDAFAAWCDAHSTRSLLLELARLEDVDVPRLDEESFRLLEAAAWEPFQIDLTPIAQRLAEFEPALHRLASLDRSLPRTVPPATDLPEGLYPDGARVFLLAKVLCAKAQRLHEAGRSLEAAETLLSVLELGDIWSRAQGASLVHGAIGVHTRLLALRHLAALVERAEACVAVRELLRSASPRSTNALRYLANEAIARANRAPEADRAAAGAAARRIEELLLQLEPNGNHAPGHHPWSDREAVFAAIDNACVPAHGDMPERVRDFALKETFAEAQARLLEAACRGGAALADPFRDAPIELLDELTARSAGPDGEHSSEPSAPFSAGKDRGIANDDLIVRRKPPVR